MPVGSELYNFKVNLYWHYELEQHRDGELASDATVSLCQLNSLGLRATASRSQGQLLF